jgi:hypothetical protein
MMSSPEERSSYEEPSSPIGRTQLGLAALFVTPSPKKKDENSNRVVDDEPFIDERKPLSMTAVKGVLSNGPSPKKMDGNDDQVFNDKLFIDEKKPSSTLAVKGVLNYGEHTLIPVTAEMIYSAVWNGERFVLKDGRPLHMVKLVGAVRNSHVNIKHVQIDVEDGTGLVRVILWRKQKECMAQRHLIDECNCNCYICVVGEVEDYYGVHEIIAFDVRPVSSGNEVTYHFLEVAYSFEKRLEYAEDEMLRAVPLK